MEKYIDDLNISNSAKMILKDLGFTDISELIKQNYFTLAAKNIYAYNLIFVIKELNQLGYLLPPRNTISIYDISMSTRLRNVLERNNILYISQLSEIPRENIVRFRNLGKNTMKELDKICKDNHITLHSIEEMHFSLHQCNFRQNI